MIEEKQPMRKQGIKKGVRTQKMMSFRIDNDNWEWLENQPSKGTAINKAIKEYRTRNLT